VWAARPATLVRDDADLVVAYLPPGIQWKRPVRPDSSEPLRMPTGAWVLEDATWTRARTLHLTVPGAAHAIHLWWLAPDWRFGGWYVNLQEPIRRTRVGFDSMDQMLDIVIEPDLSWRWKDEDELEAAVHTGLVTAAWANAVRQEGEHVIHRLQSRLAPFDEGWEHWRPDPDWPIPALGSGWHDVPRVENAGAGNGIVRGMEPNDRS
jgi:uncharacterized protein